MLQTGTACSHEFGFGNEGLAKVNAKNVAKKQNPFGERRKEEGRGRKMRRPVRT